MDKKKLESVKKIYQTAAGIYQMIESDSLDEEMKGKMLYPLRRKAPRFSHGDIRRFFILKSYIIQLNEV